MGLDKFTPDEHIIHVQLHILPDVVLEDFIYEMLIGCTYIFQTKWHDPVTEKILINDKGNLFLILKSHSDLVIVKKRHP